MTKWVLGTNDGKRLLSREQTGKSGEIILTDMPTKAEFFTSEEDCKHYAEETGLNMYEMILWHIDPEGSELDPDSEYADCWAVLAFNQGDQIYYMANYGDDIDKEGNIKAEGFNLNMKFEFADLLKMKICKDMAQRMGLEIYMIRIE